MKVGVDGISATYQYAPRRDGAVVKRVETTIVEPTHSFVV